MANYFTHLNSIKFGHLRLVDLRSPGEFKLGAMPYAVNVPLFTDEERAIVGTAYKQVGKQDAVELGLDMVANKIESFLNELMALAGPDRRLAIHCWRGGMRSGSVAKLLQVVGITPILLSGGYKAYRNEVLALLEQLATHPMLVLNGRTGSGKTEVIRHLVDCGDGALDFEGIASHRGSALGDMNIVKPQPTQQNFENQLASDYFPIQNVKTIIVEIEQDIGTIRMPPKLRNHVATSDMVLLERPMEDRIAHLQKEYASNWGEIEDSQFLARMKHLSKHIQGPIYNNILEHISRREFPQAITLLLNHRYDRCYDKSIARQANQFKDSIPMSIGLANVRKRILDLAK
jgi:tRNA 2-selenouridine synthase